MHCVVESADEIPKSLRQYIDEDNELMYHYYLPSSCLGRFPLYCLDNNDWTDPCKNDCDFYEANYCEDGGFRDDYKDYAGEAKNYPEKNCCACGKPFDGSKTKMYFCYCPVGWFENKDLTPNEEGLYTEITCYVNDKKDVPPGFTLETKLFTHREKIFYKYPLPEVCQGKLAMEEVSKKKKEEEEEEKEEELPEGVEEEEGRRGRRRRKR